MKYRDFSVRFPDLAEKHCVITGAGGGIGAGIARFLGNQGMRLTLAGLPTQGIPSVVEELNGLGVEARWVGVDLRTPEGAREVLDRAMAGSGPVHVLVNNAAHLPSRSILNMDDDHYRLSLEGNIRIYYQLTQLIVRRMVEDRDGGAVVNISSVGGLRAHRDMFGYDAAKGAIDAMTRSMSVDLAPHGIRVNGVAPGATRSPKPDAENHAEDRRMVSGIPLARLAEPVEIAAAVAFLASDSAQYITGQILYVDGGLTAQLTPPGVFI